MNFLNALILSLTLMSSQFALAENITIGSDAPSVSGKNQEGKVVSLGSSNDSVKSPLVLVYFYPKADTPGCTAQACSLRDAYLKLEKKGVKIFGVSTDSVEAQKKFKEKYKIPFDLISDSDSKIANAFEVPVRLGFAGRQAFLIHKGKVVWLDRTASTKEQAQDVLKVLDELTL
jgi:peroxiredoxin Q/BCP